MKRLLIPLIAVAMLVIPLPQTSGASHPNLNIVGIGGNFGNTEASAICTSGDLACTYSTLTDVAYNALTPAALRASYDVLIFTWASSPAVNADWATRLVPYLNLGGGIIFEDQSNSGDLAPGVTTAGGAGGSVAVSAVVPGLTDGINNSFVNNHMQFTAWDPALSPFLTNPSGTVGLWGRIGAGCIVLTGPDQDFHASRGAGGAPGNQYDLLLNEVYFVSHACGNQPPDCSNAAPSIDAIWPPNHKFVDVTVEGVTDPDGDSVTITIDSIFQDEETDALGDGAFAPDGVVNLGTAAVRAERAGGGDGRVYSIAYTADDGNGGSCSGTVLVGVPHDKKDTAVDSGTVFDSTL